MEVIADFKMIGFLMGLQGGFVKYPCYLCLWDSRDRISHYQRRHWPSRTEFTVGQKNVKWAPLIEPGKVLLPPLHIQLGLFKQFVKALNKESAAFKYLQGLFPRLSDSKTKAGVFIGPQIRKVIYSEEFAAKLTENELRAWKSFIEVVQNFLGNRHAENYEELVEDMICNFQKMGCLMSVKLHVLHAHLQQFKDNLGSYSDEQGERFHQEIQQFEKRYQGQYNERMMGDYIWGCVRECCTKIRENPGKVVFFNVHNSIK
jgi:hypothetical protein